MDARTNQFNIKQLPVSRRKHEQVKHNYRVWFEKLVIPKPHKAYTGILYRPGSTYLLFMQFS